MIPTVLWMVIIGTFSALVAAPMVTTISDVEVPLRPGRRDRCPVCGMFVLPYPEWVAQIRLRDGSTIFFDGCKDLFTYLLSQERYLAAQDRRDVTAIFVTNYYDGEMVSARSAFYVIGGDVLGPMGPELVPHRTLAAAEDFMRDHHGRSILRFDEVDDEILRTID